MGHGNMISVQNVSKNDILIITLFNYNNNPILPLSTTVIIDNKPKTYKLFNPKHEITLEEVYNNINEIRKLFETSTILCNDFKTHLSTFQLNLNKIYDVYNIPTQQDTIDHKDLVINFISEFNKIKKQRWSKLMAEASIVYQYMEDKGIYNGVEILCPKYFLDTFSGRSKCKNFNIQGTTKDDIIYSTDKDNNLFVQFDWTAADIMAAALLSEDEKLLETFKHSDPYSNIANITGASRQECKENFLMLLNSLSYNSSLITRFPKLREWMVSCAEKLDKNLPLYSILGRSYYKSSSRDEKSVFNAQMQGTVAHAMQSVLNKIYNIDKSILFCEIHDSLICAIHHNKAKDVINEVKSIMQQPFDDILHLDHKFVCKISIGKKWKQFKELSTNRH